MNTTDSRVELSWDVARSRVVEDLRATLRTRLLDALAPRLVDGVLTVRASEHRSQLRNREAAELRLLALLRRALQPLPAARRPTRPSRTARERRLADKRRRAEVKRTRGSAMD